MESIRNLLIFVFVGVVMLCGCVTAGQTGDAKATTPLLARQALGVQRVLVLAVSFPNIEPEVSLSMIRTRVLEKTERYYSIISNGKTSIIGDVRGGILYLTL